MKGGTPTTYKLALEEKGEPRGKSNYSLGKNLRPEGHGENDNADCMSAS